LLKVNIRFAQLDSFLSKIKAALGVFYKKFRGSCFE